MAIEALTGAKKIIPNAFREVLLLEEAQRAVEGRSADQQTKLRELAEAIDARMAAAESLSAWDQTPAAMVLLRDATVLAIRAWFETRGGGPAEPTAEAAFRELARQVEAGVIPAPPEGFERVRELMTDPRHLAFDDLPRAEAPTRRAEAEGVLQWLRKQVDARTVGQIKMTRVTRLGSVAVVVVVGFAWLVSWGVSKVFSAKNIALGANVQLSSRRPDCPSGSGPLGAPPSGLVDGSKSGAYDVCTNSEINPSATIELRQLTKLAKIKVYGRGDCCWGTYDLPVVLELSQDGTVYTEIARRTTPYGASDPWIVDVAGQPAKFVRMRSDSPVARELVLNEIEVFAAK